MEIMAETTSRGASLATAATDALILICGIVQFT